MNMQCLANCIGIYGHGEKTFLTLTASVNQVYLIPDFGYFALLMSGKISHQTGHK